MIKHLSINNFAIIDHLDVDFADKMSIITGETGAGKSIILGALGLILGERADSKIFFKESSKCIIEATFDISKHNLQPFFEDNEIDYDDNTIVRREINTDGKTRCFVNDSKITLSLLKELGSQLIDIHSQNQTSKIANTIFQIQVIDGFAEQKALVIDFKSKFKSYKKLQDKLKLLIDENNKSKAELDFINFQFNELELAKLKINEVEELEAEQSILSHSSDIKQNLLKASFILENSDQAIISSLKDLSNTIASVEKIDPSLKELSSRVKSIQIDLKDIASELETKADNCNINPEKLQQIEERLDTLYNLQQKHRVSSVSELIDLQNSFSKKLNSISDLDDEIEKLSVQQKATFNELVVLSKKISDNRSKAIPSLEKQIVDLLKDLSMPNAIFKIQQDILDTKDMNMNGIDNIKFLFSANQGFAVQDLGKVASGGELSRVMLAIKGISAKYNTLPTIVFDEIDTGVSGEVAKQVGNVMHKYADFFQVITITHLPQIASKGQTHFYVYKETKNNLTQTKVKKLSIEERILEIATMLSGSPPTDNAKLNAKELLSDAKNI